MAPARPISHSERSEESKGPAVGHNACQLITAPALPSFRRRPESSPGLGRVGRTWTPAFAGVTEKRQCDSETLDDRHSHSKRSDESKGQKEGTVSDDLSRRSGGRA